MESGESSDRVDTRHLSSAQLQKLGSVLNEVYTIDPLDSLRFPKIQVDPCSLILEIKTKLRAAGIAVQSAELVGGASSFVVSEREKTKKFNDLDLMLQVDFYEHESHQKFNTIRLVAKPDASFITSEVICKNYVHKMLKVTYYNGYNEFKQDCWSLICFRNCLGKNVELKFIMNMRRPYEFSSHSFHILLNDDFLQANATPGQIYPSPPTPRTALLNPSEFFDSTREGQSDSTTSTATSSETLTNTSESPLPSLKSAGDVDDRSSSSSSESDEEGRSRSSHSQSSSGDTPAEELDGEIPVEVKSCFHSFDDAVKHLNDRSIFVYKPEEIRGGGFLKFCHLLKDGWVHLGKDTAAKDRERNLMAARFCIDFPDEQSVYKALKGYLQSHFWGKKNEMIQYLLHVRTIFLNTNVNNKILLLFFIDGLISQQAFQQRVQTSGMVLPPQAVGHTIIHPAPPPHMHHR